MKVRHVNWGLDRFRILFILLLVAVVAGCENRCEPGQSRCVDETTRESCIEIISYDMPYEPPHWERDECYNEQWNVSFCVVAPTGDAHCAAEPEPRPDLCGGPEAPTGVETWNCDGVNRIVVCIDGIIRGSKMCGPGRCVVPSDGDRSFCSILLDPDPLCDSMTFSACADATTRIMCREGYRVEQDHCPGAGGCRTDTLDGPKGTFVRGLCSLAPEKDPRCEEEMVLSGQTGFCDGLIAVNCYLGYPVKVINCVRECYDHGYWTSCLGGTVGTEEGWERGDPPDCSDGFDNDYDGLTDYPDDPSCNSSIIGSG